MKSIRPFMKSFRMLTDPVNEPRRGASGDPAKTVRGQAGVFGERLWFIQLRF